VAARSVLNAHEVHLRRLCRLPCHQRPTQGGYKGIYTPKLPKLDFTRAIDVLPNTDRTQAAVITPGSDGMVPSAGAWRYLQRSRSILSLPGVMGVHSAFFVPCDLDLWSLTLTFKLFPARDQALFPVNLAQIRSAVSEIFDSQTKKNKKTHHR